MTNDSAKKRLQKALDSILKCIENGQSEWVSDNYHLIHRYGKGVQKSKAFGEIAAAERETSAYLAETGWKPTEESLCAFFGEKNRFTPMEHSVLRAVPLCIAFCAILRIGDICRGEKSASLLPDAIGVLRSLSEIRVSRLLEESWQAERILLTGEQDYLLFSDETKESYRKALSRRAKKHGRSETEEAEALRKEAKEQRVPMGSLLFPPHGDRGARWVWYSAFFLLFGLCAAWSYLRFGWLVFPLLLPLGAGIAPLCDRLASHFTRKSPILRLNLPSIPPEAKTVVAVATLFTKTQEVFDRLEQFYYLNREEQISFCLLADLPAAKAKELPEDEELISYAKEQIDLLNKRHGGRFFLLYRERAPQDDGTYGGKERKRGAVNTLVRRLWGENAGILHGPCPMGASYLLTLDGDTQLSHGIVRELVGVALHPANRHFGVFQPAVHTELFSSYKTYFTRLISGYAGVSFYERATFDRNMSLYGEGIFCGKGLLDVKKFHARATKFPEGKILSHDLPEGGLAGTLQVSDLALPDSVPASPASWYKRAHRWIRGDVQNLYFLFSRQYPLSAVSKRQILWNLFRHLTPVSSLAALVLGAAFVRGEREALLFAAVAFSHLLLPFFAGLFGGLLRGKPALLHRAFTAGISAATESVLRLSFDLCGQARQAFLTLGALLCSLWRMCISKKRLLQWTTAADAESGTGSVLGYLHKGLPGAAVGCLLFLSGSASVYRLLGIAFFVFPVVAYLLSYPLTKGGPERRHTLSPGEQAYLRRHAADAFRFYTDTVSAETNFLPPDNLQLSPFEDLAMRTSPTNVGMYLLSVLAGYDLGLMDSVETAHRLERTLTTLEGLPKFRGNLYNWYDLRDLSVLGDGFVSFVDSGNLLACLLTLEKGLEEYADREERFPALAAQCRRLLEQTDLSCFYNSRASLFSLGWNTKENKPETGCYDLLMSEARTASYYAVAKGDAPKKHWYALGRTVAEDQGYVGMVSWSGTMFEYLMPQLFLPIYRNSFLEESFLFAVHAQRKAAVNGVWGVSESGYYAFDGSLHYRYHAHGVPRLALRRDVRGEKVISPYSSYLALSVCPSAAIRNLKALESRGVYGKYGMYEAFDLTPLRSKTGVAVRSYMAHHVGMSLVAMANALLDGIMIKRFLSDPPMNAARGLLQEKLPPDPAGISPEYRPLPKEKGTRQPTHPGECIPTDPSAPKAALLCKDGFSAIITSTGQVSLRKDGRLLNRCTFRRFVYGHSLTVAFPRRGEVHGCTPFFGEGAYSFETGQDRVSLLSGSKQFSGKVQFSFCRRGDCFRVEAVSQGEKDREVLFAFQPVLDGEADFASHPSFSGLFLESEYDPEDGILYFTRRGRKNGKTVCFLAAALRDKTAAFSFCTSKDGFPAESINTPAALDRPLDNRTGICVDPFCVIRTTPGERGRAVLLLTMAATRAEARQAILSGRYETSFAPAVSTPYTNRLLTSLLFPASPPLGEFPSYRREMLWKYGVSGDYPLWGMAPGESDTEQVKRLLDAFGRLTEAGIRTELLLLPQGDGQYFRPAEKKLLSLLEERELSGFLGTRGGIFLLRKEQLEGDLESLLPRVCRVFLRPGELDQPTPAPSSCKPLPMVTVPQPIEESIPQEAFATADGYADETGYTLYKHRAPAGIRSYVLAGKAVGSVVTASSLGYTFWGNAHEHRLTPAEGDPSSLSHGEALYLRRDGRLYDLIACADRVRFGQGTALWEGVADGTSYTVITFCSKEKPFKVLRVMLSPKGGGEVIYCLRPAMGSGIDPIHPLWRKEQSGAILFRSGQDPAFSEGIGILYAKGATPVDSDRELFCGTGDGKGSLVGLCVRYNYATFLLGGGEGDPQDLASQLKSFSPETEQALAESFAEAMCPPIRVQTRSMGQNLFFHRFLPYQISACRFYARASFRQSGGAYGFRDQLQDCLALVYSDPEAVRAHILRCCSRQYEEGDVQHWWHPGGKGIRTTCSDDLLWLPLVVADYVTKTGDTSLLSAQAGYLSSPPLEGENERYEEASVSYLSETVLLHCLRAFAAADRRGKHGLLLMGICDWNDAFSAVGAKGKGESVFSTFLYVVSAKAFLPILRKEDPPSAARLEQTAAELLQNAEAHAFDGDRYLRAFCDNGEILGKEGNGECAIDILSQAFALFAGAEENRCKIALETAKKALFDPRHGILKLFAPPFDKGNTPAGYIRGYPPGLRENGGQYTHAALWGAKAFLETGDVDTALEILQGANPLLRNVSPPEAARYRSEPYAMCADIYSGRHAGRGGWSFYTGSGAWYYKIFLEDVLGIHLSMGNRILTLQPKISYQATLRYHGKLTVTVSPHEEDTLDGIPVTFPLALPDGDHTVTARLR